MSTNSKALHCGFLKHHVTQNEEITDVLKSLENALSFPIFFSQFADFADIFYGFVVLDISKLSSFVENVSFSTLYFSMTSSLSFLCVCLAASAVHEASKYSKETHKKMVKLFLTSRQGREDLILLFDLQNNPAFVLTAWSFFNFTRSLILSAMGCILTYSLLIVQVMK
ncbi:uncharacterized protein CDAR_563801 [Caerostris darwini]|uniref:Uncharacterized protein n=1 Tax=Caerostris darwini TaxID=1538125 RepID=A0AAV4UYK9_9ARAC|nr:uncharacterized protein CDAR_563801 [Caerostris darwini]